MSLQLKAIERLFDRLTATYGRQFLGLYEGLDVTAVKTLWAHELSGFADRLPDIAWALENLPERAPNAIEFRNLCRRPPRPEAPRLPEPPVDPKRIKAELAKLMPAVKAAPSVTRADPLLWARRIVTKKAGGLQVPQAVLKMAKDALAEESKKKAVRETEAA